MSNPLAKLLREPLLHFLAAGAALFVLYEWIDDSPVDAPGEIVVTTGQVEHMTSLFLKTRNRYPTEQELVSLVDEYIVEEILYREAKKIGIDQDDTIIRRRLRQKMEFMFDDYTSVEPTDDELQGFLTANPDRYRTEPIITFEHVYIAGQSLAEAETLLEELSGKGPRAADEIYLTGLVPPRFEGARQSDVANRFGPAFADSIFLHSPGEWRGPVESPFGIHLVYIEDVIPAANQDLPAIRAEVERDWRAGRRAEAESVILEGLRQQYSVTIEQFDDPDS
ncbi:MAG: peptidyl-prolyl cis-trans isomerase [Woeseiaceae bacterium]